MGVWCWSLGDTVSRNMYVHCGAFLNTPGVVFSYECGAGESSTNYTREFTLFLLADAT